MTRIDSASDVEVDRILDEVGKAVPLLRENGAEAEKRRWIPQENIDLLDKAGVFRMGVPARFGGLDSSLEEQARVLSAIASGCPSTGWVAMVWVSSGWLVTLFPDSVQEEVFAGGTVKVSGGFTPSGTLKATEGGYVLDGAWRFNSGVRGADWNIAAAILEHADGSHEEVVTIVPQSEFTIADDWDVTSAGGTGSCTSTATGVFVPEHRVVGFGDAIFNTTPGRDQEVTPGRKYGLFSYVMAAGVSAYLGIAAGALELFKGRVNGRPITYTDYEDQAQHPLTQIQVATAANKVAAAFALQSAYIGRLQARADADEQPTIEEKAELRGQAAYALQLAKEAVEIVYSASGASVIGRSAPLQRFHRDAQGLSLHGLLLLSTNLEVHGRVLLGLDPETPFL
ncbi:acyl-CoA dehydrogenase family protein [Streptomyces sp. NPDC051771]|uniref:acyl-CoA dehydrogenase family protein n=1 Tax=Streptomyces sp. NPDC051771 TaxID=3154847 RepID=UPI003441DB34